MKSAILLRTGEVIQADYKISRYERYECCYCASRVILRAGYYREPYFAHSSTHTNQAKFNCEEYHIGLGYSVPPQVTRKVISIVESKAELKQQNFFTTLCVEDSTNDFHLYLSLPNISFDKENPISLRDLQKIKLRVTAEGILIGRPLPAIELFTGGVKTRFDVKPTEKDYELNVINEAGIEVALDFLDDSVEGLSPKGNLFGKAEDEWIRIFPNSEIEWGGEFYFVGLANVSVPNKCFPTEIAVREGYTRSWKLWRITLPEEPDESVENWLNKIDYFVVEARWRLQLATVPRDSDAFGNIYHFNERESLLFKATSPSSKSKAVLVCESIESTEEKHFTTNAENDCYFSIKGRFDKIYLKGFPETEIKTIFIDDDDSDSLTEKISILPSISLRSKEEVFVGFPETNDEATNIIQTGGEFKSPEIEILLKPKGLNDFVERRVSIHFVGDAMVFKNRLTFKEAKSEILNIIRKKYKGLLTVDAGSLGIVSMSLVDEIITARFDPQPFSKISGWLSVIATSARRNSEYIGSNCDFIKSMSDRKARHKIAHSRSPFVTAHSRTMSKRKKR